MAINSPEQIKFVNEQIRPIAEKLRALKAQSDALLVDWYGGLNTQFPNDSTPVEDGRDAEGVSRLTGQNVNDICYLLAVKVADMHDAIIAKPCVRPLRAE